MRSIDQIEKKMNEMKPSNKIADEKMYVYFEGYYNALKWVVGKK